MRLAALSGAIFILAACGDVTLPAPAPAEVTPARGAEGLDVAIEVHGDSFIAAVQTNFSRRKA